MNKLQINSLPMIILVVYVLMICVGAHGDDAFNISTIPFTKGFTPLFGEHNIIPSTDDHSVQLRLNRYSGMFMHHTYISFQLHTYIHHTWCICVCVYIYQIKENIDHFTIIYMHRLRVQVLRPLQQWLLQCQNQATIGLHSRHRRRLLCTYQNSS